MIKAIEALKEALAASDELKAYNEAKKAYDADTELASLIGEYNVQATLLETEGKKSEEERDSALVETLSTRLREIYDAISANKALEQMRDAEAEYEKQKQNQALQHGFPPRESVLAVSLAKHLETLPIVL